MKKRELLTKIKKEFPELKWKTAAHNIEGWDHYVIILDNKYVFRFPRNKRYLRRLENEVAFLRYVKNKLKISVPEYIYIAKDKTFAGYLLISGDQLSEKVFEKIPRDAQSIIAKQVADFLSVLHKMPAKIANQYSTQKVDTQKLYKELVSDIKKYIVSRSSKKDRLLIENYLKEFKNYLKFPHKVFTHNDLYWSHILLNSNKKFITGIIDFGDRKIDDPARDFTELWDYGREFVEQVYKHYKGPKDADFLMRSIMYYKRVPLWIMINRLKGERGSLELGRKMFKQRF